MVGIQVRLTQEQARFVKALAAGRGVSVAAIIRGAVDSLLQSSERPSREETRQRALAAVGAVPDGPNDISNRHDHYAVEAYEAVSSAGRRRRTHPDGDHNMTSRERISTILSGGIPDRVGLDESPWGETYALWATQGMPEGCDLVSYFDMDLAKVGGPDTSFQFGTVEIAEDDTYRTFRDSRGVTCKVHKFESGHTPHWLDHLIHDQESWKANVARLAPKRDRLAADVVEQYAGARKTDRFIAVCMADPYENAWPTFGQVGIFTLMMDDPDFVGHVMMTYAELMVGMFEIMEEIGCDYDGIFMYADLGYRNSTLFNPELYRKLVQPAHALICDWQRAYGRPVICHSCGKIDVLIPNFIEAGMAAIQPLEAKCGQDVRELKKLYGKDITFFGNMDIRKLSGTREDVYEEVMGKLPIAMEGGGYIFHSDHSVPPTVSWDNYCYAMELVKKHGVY